MVLGESRVAKKCGKRQGQNRNSGPAENVRHRIFPLSKSFVRDRSHGNAAAGFMGKRYRKNRHQRTKGTREQGKTWLR